MSEQFIPLVDLKAQYKQIEKEVKEEIEKVLTKCDFVLGNAVSEFESNFAKFCDVKYSIGCGSGTDALHLACRALEIGEGDEVIMPAMTFVATALGISMTGAKPVLVDVDPDTALIDPEKIKKGITKKTKAIMPVQLFGQIADMDQIMAIAVENNLYVIEDAAQAHGAEYKGKRAGSFGDLGCFSFYPGKNLGAYGDGGAVTTSDENIYNKLKLLRNWGSVVKYHHDEIGFNSRLDTIQASILKVKLQYLDAWNEKRRDLAQKYHEALSGFEQIRLTKYDEKTVYHLYVIRVEKRDEILEKLKSFGIGAGIHYPFAVHELKAYSSLGYKQGDFPVAENWARHCLTLPIFAELPEDSVERAKNAFENIYK